MLYRMLRAVAGVTLLACAMPASATADKVIEAQTVWRFDAMSYTMDQGEPLLFRNRDAVSPGPHNVVANDEGADGKPLFASKTIPNGQEAPVEGARRLKTGEYGFICTVHPFMEATLEVTDKGSPLPPPGSGSPPPSSSPPSSSPAPASGGSPPPSGPPSPPAGQSDTRAPAVAASIVKTPFRRALLRRRFFVTVTADEAAALRVRLTARIGKRILDVGTAATTAAPGRPARLAIRASRAAIRALRRARRAAFTLAVEARDGSGNVGTATARRRFGR